MNESLRLLLNLVRKGTVLAVDYDKALCRVATGELQTNWLPWLTLAAGDTRDWNPPSEGEQVILLSPGGDPAEGVVLRGIYSDSTPAPANKKQLHTRVYPDGATVQYDHVQQLLSIDLPKLAAVFLTALSLVKIKTATLSVEGSVKASRNVTVGTGASGSFATTSGNIVTVMDGIVINIA